MVKAAAKPKAAASNNVTGAGFKKKFSATELAEIKDKRREMRARLFAVG